MDKKKLGLIVEESALPGFKCMPKPDQLKTPIFWKQSRGFAQRQYSSNWAGGCRKDLVYTCVKTSRSRLPFCVRSCFGLSFRQTNSDSNWADRFYLGWLLRCLFNPAVFVPRYLRLFGLSVFWQKWESLPKVVEPFSPNLI